MSQRTPRELMFELVDRTPMLSVISSLKFHRTPGVAYQRMTTAEEKAIIANLKSDDLVNVRLPEWSRP